MNEVEGMIGLYFVDNLGYEWIEDMKKFLNQTVVANL